MFTFSHVNNSSPLYSSKEYVHTAVLWKLQPSVEYRCQDVGFEYIGSVFNKCPSS